MKTNSQKIDSTMNTAIKYELAVNSPNGQPVN